VSVKVLQPGILTLLVDDGRRGWQHLGISPAGAFDALSYQLANRLLGNHRNACALEMTLYGATLRFKQDTIIAICGAHCDVQVNGRAVPCWQALPIRRGDIVKCGAISAGMRCYLAVAGGFDAPAFLQSRTTQLNAGLGGVEGRALIAGDRIKLFAPSAQVQQSQLTPLKFASHFRLRILQGQEKERLGDKLWRHFLQQSYPISAQSNRMGLRLVGSYTLSHSTEDIYSSAVSCGCIQLPPSGQPLIAGVEAQTIGGYPRIAHVIEADLHLLGQLSPRHKVSFQAVSIDEAIDINQAKRALVNALLAL